MGEQLNLGDFINNTTVHLDNLTSAINRLNERLDEQATNTTALFRKYGTRVDVLELHKGNAFERITALEERIATLEPKKDTFGGVLFDVHNVDSWPPRYGYTGRATVDVVMKIGELEGVGEFIATFDGVRAKFCDSIGLYDPTIYKVYWKHKEGYFESSLD